MNGSDTYRNPASPPHSPTPRPRVGWLFHLNDATDLFNIEPGLAHLSSEDLEDHVRRLEPRLAPIVLSSTGVTSRTRGAAVDFDAILLPVTARRIRALLDAGDTRWLRGLVQQGIDRAEERGCRLVSLGQYTSIVMRNGLAVRPGPIGVTTGNSFTAALTVTALEKYVPDLAYRTVAVVGAGGNIGAAVADLLSERCGDLILIGRDRPGALARMKNLQLSDARISTDVEDCRLASVVVVAVSTPETVVRADCLAPGTLVCDLSVPAGADIAGRDDVALVGGGVARLPGGEDFRLPGFPLEPGLAYACMAEALLLGLDGVNDRFFTGRITPAHVRRLGALVKEHGFEPAVWDLSALESEVHHACA